MDQYWFEYPYGAYIASSKSKAYLRGDDPSTFRPYEMVNVWTSLPSGKSWLRDPRFLLGLLLYFSGFVALDLWLCGLVGNDPYITGLGVSCVSHLYRVGSMTSNEPLTGISGMYIQIPIYEVLLY